MNPIETETSEKVPYPSLRHPANLVFRCELERERPRLAPTELFRIRDIRELETTPRAQNVPIKLILLPRDSISAEHPTITIKSTIDFYSILHRRGARSDRHRMRTKGLQDGSQNSLNLVDFRESSPSSHLTKLFLLLLNVTLR